MKNWVWGDGWSYGYEPPYSMTKRTFVALWFFNGWGNIQLGLHVSVGCPNAEIHLPFGFIRIGWRTPLNKKTRVPQLARVAA